MKNILSRITIIALSSTAIMTSATAQVKSVTNEDFVQIGSDAFWVFAAICDDDSERKIQRKADGTDWCGQDLDGFCDADKANAAELVCDSKYTEGLAAAEESARAAREQELARQQQQQEEQQRLERQRAEQERAQREQAAAAARTQRIEVEQELAAIERERNEIQQQQDQLQRRAAQIKAVLGQE